MIDKNPYRTLHARMSPPGAAWDEGFAAGRAERLRISDRVAEREAAAFAAGRAAATPDPPTSWDASNCVRFCDRCDAEYGITAGADVGDTACSGCGAHDASHIYPHRPAASPDERLREAGVWPDQSAMHGVLLDQIKDAYAEGIADTLDRIRVRAAEMLPEVARFTLDEIEALAAADREAPDEETTDA